ncbi:MAG TPA: 16S rRNA (guanine(527)-N(7))-methyltransferase RsmG [Pseudonocardiaceae bacterium]|nr:16S rRNA (guanine(527)-N(7))-methyltransferase RsmG [Pseudonocardiaceae bacterium]
MSEGNTLVAANRLFGDRLPLAEQYVDMLTRQGVQRGLIGPREVDRLWDRHVLNSAAVAELIPANSRVVDVGSGAGLPGIPLAIARPDLSLALLEPMARRIDWLDEVVAELGLDVFVRRGRAEEGDVRRELCGADVVTARAVAPLAKLAGWCLPLLRRDGWLVALKGASAAEELTRDAVAIGRAGGGDASVRICGSELAGLATPTTVIVIRCDKPASGRDDRRRTRKDR